MAEETESDVITRLSPIRHPEQHSVRVMRELCEFVRIDCHENHIKVGRTGSSYRGVAKQDSKERLFSHRINV
jgi:hypothetical protein